MKIAYIGIDLFFSALKALSDNGCEIYKIFTCKTDNITEFNTDIIRYAKEYNIPYTLDKITQEDINMLVKDGVECIICGGYYYRIPIVEGIAMLNIHPTALPVGRGLWPMPIMIMEGYKKIPRGLFDYDTCGALLLLFLLKTHVWYYHCF